MKRFNFYLPEQLIARLKKLSGDTGLSVSDHVRRAIENYLESLGGK